MENQTNNVASTTKTAKTVSKAQLTAMVDSGSKKQEIAEYYGLNMAQTTNLLKSVGLKIRKFHAPAFIIVE